jgi:hypothetical protein
MNRILQTKNSMIAALLTVIALTFSSCKEEVNVQPISLKVKAAEAKTYCQKNGLDQNLCILVDFSVHSGKKRMFVYDMKNDSLLASGMVSHGCGDQPWGMDFTKSKPVFSNEHESHCSSIGKFKIGKRGYSNWGINVNYKLHGLESSNSNAYDRIIVLHSWKDIPNGEVYPQGTPEGWGCPAVSNEFMTYLDGLLKNKEKDVLLWIYQE